MGVVFCLHCSSSAGNTSVWLHFLSLPCELGPCALLVERKKHLEESQILLPFITKWQDAKAREPCSGSEALGCEGDIWSRWGAGGQGCSWGVQGLEFSTTALAACLVGWISGSPSPSCRAVRGLCWTGLVTEQICPLHFLSNPVLPWPRYVKILW